MTQPLNLRTNRMRLLKNIQLFSEMALFFLLSTDGQMQYAMQANPASKPT